MNALFDLSLQCTRWLQAAFPALQTLLSLLSDLVYIDFLVPIVYWSVDKRLGRYLVMLVTCNNLLNEMVKPLFHGPRPFWLDSSLELDSSRSFGIPSGHAQSSILTSFSLLRLLPKRWLWWVAALFTLAMGLSRVYLGVHFLHDIAMGYLLGGIVLVLGWRWQNNVEPWGRGLTFVRRLAVVGGVTAVLTLLSYLAYRIMLLPQTAVSWQSFIPHAQTESTLGNTQALGIFIATLLGFILENRYLQFQTHGTLRQHLLRWLLGFGGAGILYIGLSECTILPNLLLHFLGYFSVMFWMVYLAPSLFAQLGLVQPIYLSQRPTTS